MATTTTTNRGLEDIIAGSSSICYIDGRNGILAYRGIDIHELADNSTFEEVTHLLWHGKLPTRTELAEFSVPVGAQSASWMLRSSACCGRRPGMRLPMDVLRTIVSSLSFFDPEEKVNTKRGELPEVAAAVLADCHDRGGL